MVTELAVNRGAVTGKVLLERVLQVAAFNTFMDAFDVSLGFASVHEVMFWIVTAGRSGK